MKVGDQVRILGAGRTLEEFEKGSGVVAASKMFRYAGETGTIVRLSKKILGGTFFSVRIDKDKDVWTWHEGDLAPLRFTVEVPGIGEILLKPRKL